VVPEINLRHGHRAQAINGGRVLKHKITSRQCKHLLTMDRVHPDAQEAINNLLRFGLTATETLLDANEIEQAVAEEDAALNIIQDIHIDDLDDESEDENDNLEVNVALITDIASSK
jgi:hypothetical protein